VSELTKSTAKVRFQLDDEPALEYTIGSFSGAKVIELTGVISSVVKQSGAGHLVDAYRDYQLARLTGANSEFFGLLLAELPDIFRKCKPAIYELLGLLLMPNKQIKQAEIDGESVQELAVNIGREAANAGSVDQLFEAVKIGLGKVSDKSLVELAPEVGNFLLAMMRS
jgi:hypothetical protein